MDGVQRTRSRTHGRSYSASERRRLRPVGLGVLACHACAVTRGMSERRVPPRSPLERAAISRLWRGKTEHSPIEPSPAMSRRLTPRV